MMLSALLLLLPPPPGCCCCCCASPPLSAMAPEEEEEGGGLASACTGSVTRPNMRMMLGWLSRASTCASRWKLSLYFANRSFCRRAQTGAHPQHRRRGGEHAASGHCPLARGSSRGSVRCGRAGLRLLEARGTGRTLSHLMATVPKGNTSAHDTSPKAPSPILDADETCDLDTCCTVSSRSLGVGHAGGSPDAGVGAAAPPPPPAAAPSPAHTAAAPRRHHA